MNSNFDLVFGHSNISFITKIAMTDIVIYDYRLVSFDVNEPFVWVSVSTFIYCNLKRVDMNLFRLNVNCAHLIFSQMHRHPVDEYITRLHYCVIWILSAKAAASLAVKAVQKIRGMRLTTYLLLSSQIPTEAYNGYIYYIWYKMYSWFEFSSRD